MKYVERLLADTDYLEQMKLLEELEKERRFCRHGLSHVLDVARIAWIEVLEQHLPFEKEEIYLVALLHDMGRIQEYQEGIPHHVSGVMQTEIFLDKISYPAEKRSRMMSVVEKHREKDKLNDDFINIIKQADNSSRNCFYCEVSSECKWSTERKNKTIIS